MTFTFHEPNDICSVNLMTQPAASPLSLGDMIEQELSECASAVQLPLTASTSVDSASPICNRKIQAAVTQEDRYSGGDEVMSVECFMYDPEYIETPDSELAQESTKLTDSPAVRCHGGSPNQTMGTKWLEELNVTDEDLSSDDDASVILDELAHAVTREIEEDSENEIIKIMEKNQRESFYQFEKVALEERESAAFISLPPSPENVLPARNAIDALFETPGYIPQSFESDEEDGQEQ
ncbi:hypothetical protein DPMN_171388 [Dreissena polymorpha]|uniref:Uncharacterized protein n=1 Tax=Dreissena polymorpha TaxID=45954 RepID=A0A9D4DZ30_DREPO|nr:hypothetical protein DPMN_171388 [Dreissena polymorpha]